MPQNSYQEIADQTIKSFINAVVLIDDHWAEAQNAPILPDVDSSQLNFGPTAIPPEGIKDETITTDSSEDTSNSMSVTDPSYLREIGEEIIKQGFLFTGFSYTDACKETAFKLASKSDILILDWYLGNADSRPALELLENLKANGSPRFVFILTDHDLEDVHKRIVEQIGEKAEGTGTVFNCGPFSFSLKNKPQAGGSNCVSATQVLEEAISGIRERFGGLLQLAALELLGQYRDCLHEMLDIFDSDTDLPFILEWLEGESPIRDNHSFNALAMDEWTASVTRRYPSSIAQIIKNETVSSLLMDWKDKTKLPDDYIGKIENLVKEEDTKFTGGQDKISELVESLDEWMTGCNCKWPTSLKGQPRGKAWAKDTKRRLAMEYLGLRKGIISPIETLKKLDVLFQCQGDLPSKLNQGTVLINPDGIYLICITPTCDCSRPHRIKNCYVFLEAHQEDISTLGDHPEGTVVAIRTKENGNLMLVVSLKPTYTYKISNPSLNGDLIASLTYGSEDTFVIKPVAQLRPSRIQSLISQATGKAIEVGLDRSEILRQLCKSN